LLDGEGVHFITTPYHREVFPLPRPKDGGYFYPFAPTYYGGEVWRGGRAPSPTFIPPSLIKGKGARGMGFR